MTRPGPDPAREPLALRRRTPVAAAGTLLAAALLTKVTGFLRVAALAALLGASTAGDAFLTAYLLPEVLYFLFTEGGVCGALVRAMRGPRPAHALGAALVAAGLASLGLVAATLLGAAPAVRVLGPGLDPVTQAQVVGYLHQLSAYVPMILGYFVLHAALNAQGHFLGPALGPLLFNLAVLAAAAAAAPGDAQALIHGVLLGGALQLGAALVPAVKLLPRPSLADRHASRTWAQVRGLALPTVMLAAAMQLQYVCERALLSTSATGTITRFATTQRLVALPLGLLAVTLVTALMPYLAARADTEGPESLGPAIERALSALVWSMAPVTAGMAALSLPLVSLAFGRGAFAGSNLSLTAELVEVAAPGTVYVAASMLLVRGFLAAGDARTPTLVKVAVTAGVLGTDAALLSRFGARTLFAVSAAFALAETLWLLGRLPGAGLGTVKRAAADMLKAGLASAVLFVAARALAPSLAPGAPWSAHLEAIAVGGAAGLGAFALAAWALGAPGPRQHLEALRSLRA